MLFAYNYRLGTEYAALKNCNCNDLSPVMHKSRGRGNVGTDENEAKEKEVDISTSNSDVNAGCAYTSRVVDESGLAPESYRFCLSFLHTYSAFILIRNADERAVTDAYR